MIPVYNEADIIGYVIEHLISQGIELAILNNGSTDNSYGICSRYFNKGVEWLEVALSKRFGVCVPSVVRGSKFEP